MIFLGLASNYHAKDIFRHSYMLGTRKDYNGLEADLAKRYGATLENTSLIFSGRSAISLGLKSFLAAKKLEKGDLVGVNAFTCYAVIEAIKHAGLTPFFLDLEKDFEGKILPNFSARTLEAAVKENPRLKVFILQNTFGVTVNISEFEKVREKYNLLLLEDLAHCAGRFYESDSGEKVEVGTVGDAVALSFGKGKAIDTILGGAVLLRDPLLSFPKSFKKEKLIRRRWNGDVPRASWYPIFGAIARGLSHLHLEKLWLGLLLKLSWIERSADTKLLEDTTITFWQARLARRQLKNLSPKPLREYFLVENREELLKNLRRRGFRLEEVWYEVPVAPERYFKKLDFPKESCPNAVFFAEHVVNLPTWYSDKKHKKEVSEARKIIKSNEVK